MAEIILAFLAGLITVASPCILPLLPILLGASLGNYKKSRPLFIVLGFVLVFSLAAVLLSVAAKSFGLDPNIIRDIGIALLAIFGVLLIWAEPFEKLALLITPLTAKVSQKAGLGNSGSWSAFVLGASLGLVWTPCAGPVLASILTIIAIQSDLVAAFILLLAYALGVAVPMLIIAYGGQFVSKKVQWISKYSTLLQQIFGVIILALAVLMYFHLDTLAYTKLLQYYPALNPKL
jgi:cytochrome c biogenesis protein CcdA